MIAYELAKPECTPSYKISSSLLAKVNQLRVLGIETSCDETGVAIYDEHRGLLAHALYSQAEIHAEYGGVVPEIASRDHVRKLLPLVDQVIDSQVVYNLRCRGRAGEPK